MAKLSKIFMAMGLLLLVAALCFAGYNLRAQARAGEASSEALALLLPELEKVQEQPTLALETEVSYEYEQAAAQVQPPVYAENPQMDMPIQMVAGQDYIGVLAIPALSLELPVISEWTMERLGYAPCRYSGSAYQGDLVISGHNYAGHFRDLRKLLPGDAVTFTDMDGNVFSYTVSYLETLAPEAVEEMVTGEWDLTLFTCTPGGQNRVAVRCELAEDF